MIDLIQKTQREFQRVLRVKTASRGGKPTAWASAEGIGELIELYSAQGGHLGALTSERRWMSSLPPGPYEERVSELRHLYAVFLESEPPEWIRKGIEQVMERTFELSASFVAQDAWESPFDEPLLAQISQHEEMVWSMVAELQALERRMTGPAPPVPLAPVPGEGRSVG